VHRVADLGRREADRARTAPRRVAQARDALGVVAVRAALEERERRVRQAAGTRMDRRRRDRRELRQRVAARRRSRPGSSAKSASCPDVVGPTGSGSTGPARPATRRSTRTRNVAPSRSSSNGASAGRELLLALEPAEHPADRRVAAVVDRARDDQPVDRRVSSRRSRGAGARRRSASMPGRAHLRRRRTTPCEAPVAGMTTLKPKRPSESAEDLVGGGRAARVAPGVRDHDDLELEPLRGVDREQPHRVGALLLRDRPRAARRRPPPARG
jgi:hypothetical protein